MGSLTARLITILGQRAFWSFCVVTFLVAALLAAVNLTSRYALKLYVESQLERTPWDLALYKTGGFTGTPELPESIRQVPGVQKVENLVFLRAVLPAAGEVGLEVNGKPLGAPWICMLAATDLSLLPPELHLAVSNPGAEKSQAAVMALVGPERAMGQAFLGLQGAREFGINVKIAGRKRMLFTTPIRGVIRLNRDELNRWLMDQTGSISFVPHIAVILLMPYRHDILRKFDSAASGLVPPELIGPGEGEYAHVQKAEYVPEVVYLGRVDRPRLISGWDLPGSMQNMADLRERVQAAANALGADTFADSTTLVLLERMAQLSRLIGLVTLLIALPLLWMAWVLAANLSGLLMLNERRTLGLMRLRGVPGRLLGRALLWTICSAGVVGGVLGLVAGSVIPLLVYEKGQLPSGVLEQGPQLLLFLLFLVITVVLTLLVSRRLVRYAVTISPLEASGRVAGSEAIHAAAGFGLLQFLALLLGTYALAGWIFDFSLFAWFNLAFLRYLEQALNFIGLPLFLYGVAGFLVSRRSWIQKLLSPLLRPLGGRLGTVALRHISVKPHRTVAFLLIVALMASVSLYPLITRYSFEDRTVRGARVQTGTEWQLTFNSPDLVGVERLRGALGGQLAALRPEVQKIVSALSRVEGVESATFMFEALLPGFYIPDYGLRGVPLYLIGDVAPYLQRVYAEPEVGLSEKFPGLIGRLKNGEVAVSPPVADFWRLSAGTPVLMGLDRQRNTVFAPTGGVLGFLPGTPPRTVTDRQGYVQARVDYLNYLFSENAYLVAAADNPQIANLQALIPRVIVLVKVEEGVPLGSLQSVLLGALPTPPLEAHNLTQEIQKLGSDMFIYLAMQNMKIYLLGGLLLALIAILAVALANYAEDRRTLALLRIRGASLILIWRFLMGMLMSPALLGLILGGLVSLVAGYGLTNHIWKLRELKTVVHLLPTHLVVSPLTAGIAVLLLAMLTGVASLFSLWVFRRTARENIQEG